MATAMFRYYAKRGNAAPVIRKFKSDTSSNATFKAGDPVQLYGTGSTATVRDCVAVSNTFNTDVDFLGIALKDASGASAASTTNDIPVLIATENMEFMFPAYNATAASALPSAVEVGESTTMYRASTGVYGVNVGADGTKSNVKISGKVPGCESEVYGPLWIKVLTGSGRTLG